jgi:hypothetical protein
VCLISTVHGEGIYAEPLLEVSTRNLTAAIAGRIAYIQDYVAADQLTCCHADLIFDR